jgi:putative transposase
MANLFHKEGLRNSYTELNEIYFWTITIRDWIPVLQHDAFKHIITDSLKWLHDKELVKIYGFVIMPNHIHMIWTQLKMNGREFPKNSFEKFTAHQFTGLLRKEDPGLLSRFIVNATERAHNIWQRDPLAIRVFSREICEQKLDYIHNNPLQEHWNLCKNPVDYTFSSALFYEQQIDTFGFLTHYMDVF